MNLWQLYMGAIVMLIGIGIYCLLVRRNIIQLLIGIEVIANSVDARTATVTKISWDKLNRISKLITSIKGVNRCLYDLTPKPPATIEYI